MSRLRTLRTKLFHLYFLLRRPMTLGVRAIVEDKQGRVLLVRHTYVKGWYFPGGGVETGQTMEQALAMELREEVEIWKMGEVELLGIYLNRHISKRDHVALYRVRNWGEQGIFQSNREIAEIGFFPLDDLPPGTTKSTRTRLGELYHEVKKSNEW
jgi:ADP-ribose pyrophosphatase YjhB (NUDIX family)